ncbi:hypothetical protein V1506DRAFT_535684 [Lipomyces tetrasporus]
MLMAISIIAYFVADTDKSLIIIANSSTRLLSATADYSLTMSPKVVVITGSNRGIYHAVSFGLLATDNIGIGFELATQFSKRGDTVIATVRRRRKPRTDTPLHSFQM